MYVCVCVCVFFFSEKVVSSELGEKRAQISLVMWIIVIVLSAVWTQVSKWCNAVFLLLFFFFIWRNKLIYYIIN